MSPASKIIYKTLKFINFRKIVEKQAFHVGIRQHKEFVPADIKKRYHYAIRAVRNKTVLTFENKQKVTNTHVVFLHGGAYIFGAATGHWSFLKEIVNRSYCRITAIDYPLAPEFTYRETIDMVENSYELLVKNYPDDNFIFLGDSAGGGLALVMAQKLSAKNNTKLPVKNILLSPWLDMSMSNPETEKQRNSDLILTLEMLACAASKYSGGDSLSQPELSPLFGSFENLSPTLVFYGTEELFYADIRKMKQITSMGSHQFIYREYAGMQHDWVLFPIPERESVITEICHFME